MTCRPAGAQTLFIRTLGSRALPVDGPVDPAQVEQIRPAPVRLEAFIGRFRRGDLLLDHGVRQRRDDLLQRGEARVVKDTGWAGPPGIRPRQAEPELLRG